ncbi:MAG: tRNA (adenosine(37)-N6)-dimethylallyltransferase MiaA [Patescibacteria group bacterium]
MARFLARKERRNPLIVIVGPTASGKSDLAVKLARKFHGEIISADSRQVYKGLDIGSGKITRKEMMSIPHHLLDVTSPRHRFTVAQYQRLALKAIHQIHRKGKLPILVGGSPFYIYSVVYGIAIPEVKPDFELRKRLEKLSVDNLYKKLKQLDPERAKTIEAKNPRRLIRALEIVIKTNKPVPPLKKQPLPHSILMLGIKRSPEELKKPIRKRLLDRLDHGMINEVRSLKKSGLSWKRLESFGLEYRFVAQYLQGKISRSEMLNQIQKSSEDFARRQMTWFKKDSRIHWVKDQKEAKGLVTSFLK